MNEKYMIKKFEPYIAYIDTLIHNEMLREKYDERLINNANKRRSEIIECVKQNVAFVDFIKMMARLSFYKTDYLLKNHTIFDQTTSNIFYDLHN
jgi:hypothetical protein